MGKYVMLFLQYLKIIGWGIMLNRFNNFFPRHSICVNKCYNNNIENVVYQSMEILTGQCKGCNQRYTSGYKVTTVAIRHPLKRETGQIIDIYV